MTAPQSDGAARGLLAAGLAPRVAQRLAPDLVDFARAADDYANHRPPFDPRLFTRLAALGVGLPNQLILDVGAGTGLLGRGLCDNHCRVIESDLRLSLLRQSLHPARVAARAEHLPFPDQIFDAVTAGQCWHWFDRHAAPLEIKRVLKTAGRVAIVYQTYLPLPGNVAAASEAVILRHRPRWRHAGGVGINGQALKDLQAACFTNIESFSFDVDIPYAKDAWRGFIRTCSAIAPSLSADAVARFDAEHAPMLDGWPEPLVVPHRVFAAVATRPVASRR